MARSRRSTRPSTRQLIAQAALELFNESGYASTSLARIAEAVGITEGNLWYHFRAKEDLATELLEQLIGSLETHYQTARGTASVLEEYVGYFHGVMRDMLRFRFLMRDYLQLVGANNGDISTQLANFQANEYERLTDILTRMRGAGLMANPTLQLDELATNIWIVVRYWWSYLQDRERIERISWSHQQRGFRQNVALLEPHLKADAVHKMRAIGAAIELQEPADLVS